LRSLLFAPANHARRVEKALASSADAAILDLEDALLDREKPAGRAALQAATKLPRRALLYVRINALTTPHARDDLASLPPDIDGIVIPKCESVADVGAVAAWAPKAALLPLIETARGLQAAEAIAASSPKIRHLVFGALDFALDLDLSVSPDEIELRPYRAMLVLASRLAGKAPPLDTPWPDFRDMSGLRASAERGRRMGFAGKLCIHPDQLAVVQDAFAFGAAEIAEAERIVAAAADAERQGLGAVQLAGKMIDAPVIARARRVLNQA